jgi:hypothetical protein
MKIKKKREGYYGHFTLSPTFHVQPGEVVLLNVSPKRFCLHQQIRFTNTATAGAATATAVPNGPLSWTTFDGPFRLCVSL